MKFKEVAHLYIGCMCEVSAFGDEFIEELAGVKRGTVLVGGNKIDVFTYPHYKPILRPINSITADEIKKLFAICYEHFRSCKLPKDLEYYDMCLENRIVSMKAMEYTENKKTWYFQIIIGQNWQRFLFGGKEVIVNTSILLLWLTKHKIDMFGLIKNNEALDATQMEINPYK